jgi:hypothetical protein
LPSHFSVVVLSGVLILLRAVLSVLGCPFVQSARQTRSFTRGLWISVFPGVSAAWSSVLLLDSFPVAPSVSQSPPAEAAHFLCQFMLQQHQASVESDCTSNVTHVARKQRVDHHRIIHAERLSSFEPILRQNFYDGG